MLVVDGDPSTVLLGQVQLPAFITHWPQQSPYNSRESRLSYHHISCSSSFRHTRGIQERTDESSKAHSQSAALKPEKDLHFFSFGYIITDLSTFQILLRLFKAA